MRGKKKRRVSVRHISPRWSRVLNSERRATSGWDPPLRAFSLPSPIPSPPPFFLHPPFHPPLESVSCATNDSYAAMPLSKFDRNRLLSVLSFVSSDLHVKGNPLLRLSTLNTLERADFFANLPRLLFLDFIFIRGRDIYLKFHFSFSFFFHFPSTFDTRRRLYNAWSKAG